MMSLFDNINWVLVLIVIWAVLFGCGLISRLLKLKGTPGGLAEPGKGAFLFDETCASVRSHKSTLTRLGGGMRCMHVSITLDTVMIRPHFPFSLVGADADLVHGIPIKKITGIRLDPHARTFGITIDFERDQGAGRIDVDLKRPAEFMATIRELTQGPNQPPEPMTAKA